MEDHELEQLIAAFSNSKQQQQANVTSNRQAINSIRVFRDSIYIEYAHEEDSIDAVKFFNNYSFKSNRIQAVLIKKCLSQEPNKDTNDENDVASTHQASQMDCEILVANRQLK